jgi:hypothetical protein
MNIIHSCETCRHQSDGTYTLLKCRICNNYAQWELKLDRGKMYTNKEEIMETQWKRFEDEMPDEKRYCFIWGETRTCFGVQLQCPGEKFVGNWTHWQYANVPKPPVEERKRKENIEKHICKMVHFGTDNETTDDNFMQIFRKINEIIDKWGPTIEAANEIRQGGK